MENVLVMLNKHRRLVIGIVGVTIVIVLIYALRAALLPFLVGLVIVRLMGSAVSSVEKRFPHRVLSIVIVNAVILVAIGVFGYFVFSTVVKAFTVLLQDANGHWAQAVATLQQMTESTRQSVPAGVRDYIDQLVVNAGQTITAAVKTNFDKSVAQIPSAFGTVLGFAILPVFVFYILKDREKLSKGFYSSMPQWVAVHIKNILLIIDNVLGRYIRATLTLGAAVGSLTLIGLLIIGAPLAPLLAIVAGITEMIPALGPWIGAAIAAVVTLALAPDKLIFVVVLFIVVQLLENTLLVPRIQGGYLGFHPVVIIVLLAIGAAVAGVWGLLLMVPLTATGIQIYRYFRQAIREQVKQQESVAERPTD